MKRALAVLLAAPLLLTACSSEPETVTVTETETTTVTETIESTPETITITASPEEPQTEEQTSTTTRQRVTSVDQIGAKVVRDYGVEISDQDYANVSTPICDLFESGGTLADANQLVITELGTSDWQATKVVQGSVVQKCVQYVDRTY